MEESFKVTCGDVGVIKGNDSCSFDAVFGYNTCFVTITMAELINVDKSKPFREGWYVIRMSMFLPLSC